MTHKGAVAEAIRKAAAEGRVEFDVHALKRMRQRGISAAESIHAQKNLTSIRPSWKTHVSDWTVQGPDFDGMVITLGVLVDGDVYVITLF